MAMTMPLSPRFRYAGALWVVLFFIALTGTAAGDTVYLKNGSLIDGRITYRTDASICLQIGEIGKLEISLEEIYLIEKNKRVGGEVLKSEIDSKGKREIISEDGTKDDDEADDDSEDSDEPDADEQDDALVTEPPVVGEEEAEKIDPKLKDRIESLIADLGRKKRRYRVRAERHLKAIGRPALPFLLPLADSKMDLTRVATYRLFYQFGDETVVEPSIKALLDVNEYVRDYANKTLIRITGEDLRYRAQATPRRRELAARKWVKWWQAELKELEKTRKEFARDDASRG